MFKIPTIIAVEKNLLTRLDPRAKLIVLFSIGIIVISLDKVEWLLILLFFPLLGHLLARFELDKYKTGMLIILLGLWGITISQAMFYKEYPRTVILTLIPQDFPLIGRITDGIYLYKEGLLYGLAQGLRFANMSAFGLLIAWSTEPKDLLMALIRLKVPYGVAFMFIVSIRFIPVLISELFTVITVQRLRGAKPTKLGIKNIINVLTPVLANSVKRVSVLAASCESRAFNPQLTRTYLRELHYRWWDILILAFFITVATAIAITKILFWLYKADILYFSSIRWLYTIAREL